MYLEEKRIRLFTMKNVILVVLGSLFIIVSIAIITNLLAYYADDLQTAIHATAFRESFWNIAIGVLLILIAVLSGSLIGDARFFCSFYENDLVGVVAYDSLSELTGKSTVFLQKEMHFLRRLYMKGFSFEEKKGAEQVLLDSKTVTCNCTSCGAVIEKKVYFTGVCPYCGGSDLKARVITGERFYSIDTDIKDGYQMPDFYKSTQIERRKVLIKGGMILLLLIGFFCLLGGLEAAVHYGDKDYLNEVLLSGKGPYSIALIQAELLEGIIWDVMFILGFAVLVLRLWGETGRILTAEKAAPVFSRAQVPHVDAQEVQGTLGKPQAMRYVAQAVRSGYLQNCSFEKVETVRVALGRKIVKDKCPHCMSPITGVTGDAYVCPYCSEPVMGVVTRK